MWAETRSRGARVRGHIGLRNVGGDGRGLGPGRGQLRPRGAPIVGWMIIAKQCISKDCRMSRLCGAKAVRAKIATGQSRIIKRHVLFVPAIHQIAVENLLHCNRIGAFQDENGRSRVIIEHHGFG